MRKLALAALLAGGCTAAPEVSFAPLHGYIVTATCAQSCDTSDLYTTTDADAARGRFVIDGDLYLATEPSIGDRMRPQIRDVADGWNPADPHANVDLIFGAPDGTWVHLSIDKN
jgi:hypothetical protein